MALLCQGSDAWFSFSGDSLSACSGARFLLLIRSLELQLSFVPLYHLFFLLLSPSRAVASSVATRMLPNLGLAACCSKVKTLETNVGRTGCCCCPVTKLSPTLYDLWTAAHQAPLSITVSWNLLRFMAIELVMPANHLILVPPSSPFAFNLSQHQGRFQWVGSLHKVAKVLELQL